MNCTRIYLAFLFVISMVVVPCNAFALFGAEVGVGYWQQSPSGYFSYESVSPLDQLDLENDLHFDKQSEPFVRIKVELPLILPNLYFMATPMTFEGSGNMSRTDVNYGGETFSGTAYVESKLKLDHYDLALFYPIPLLKTATAGMLNIELGLNIRNLVFEGFLSAPAAGVTSASDDVSLYVPMLYMGVQIIPIEALSIEAELRLFSASGNSNYDYLGRLKYSPIPMVFVAGGYRVETIDIDEEDVFADLQFEGPFLEVGVSF
jgi:outer membrane protein